MQNTDGQAIILNCTPDPERIVAAAARLTSTSGTATEIYHRSPEGNSKLVSKVVSLGHTSLIEHVYFTIAFENCTPFFEQFMIEFRLASFTIQSRRYVDFSKNGYYIPEFRFERDIPEADKQNLLDTYHQHMVELFNEYLYLIEQGIPKEDARFILPYSFKGNFYCTLNARELIHVIYAALYGRGSHYAEIKKIGESLFTQAKTLAPDIFENLIHLEDEPDDKEALLRDLLGKHTVPEDEGNTELTELLYYTADIESRVAIATLINHTQCSSKTARELINSDSGLREKLLEIVLHDKRKRELEQVEFTFRINNISLACLTHLVRHRIQSINIPSFTQFGKSKHHVIPESIKQNEELFIRYQKVWDTNRKIYQQFLDSGVQKEDLVYLYLSGNVLNIVTTMNARELIHFFHLRTCQRAQWETRYIALDMLKKTRQVAPGIFNYVGPSCFPAGKCPEGKFSCGQMGKMSELFDHRLR
ncbi:MAG TPA: FAD-dependent thymidylate synthase [Bacillota bacterium]|nr:FAD-dependent thymidylate synthase [Bacillota bacterium]